MTNIVTMSWAVEYDNGEILSQYDQNGKEVPLKSIDWSRAIKIFFESQFFKAAYHLDPIKEDSEIVRSLRIRHFRSQAVEMHVLMLIHSMRGQEINEDSVLNVFYVTPNGIIHECDYFWCSEIAQYLSNLFNEKNSSVPLIHKKTSISTEAILHQ